MIGLKNSTDVKAEIFDLTPKKIDKPIVCLSFFVGYSWDVSSTSIPLCLNTIY